MALHPNRIGGARGNTGATLKQTNALLSEILAALEDLRGEQSATNTRLDELSAKFGAPEETDCGHTLLGGICTIATALVGSAPVSGPPATCPGFPVNPPAWYNVGNWYQDIVPGGEFVGVWRGVITPTGVPGTLYVDTYQPYPESPEYELVRIRTTTDGTNLCISWNVPDGGAYNVMTLLVDAATNNTLSFGPLWLEDELPIGSNGISLDADQAIVLSAQGPEPVLSQPLARLWIVQGAFG